MDKFILSLEKALVQAKADYERQWELYPGFDAESFANRMRLTLQYYDADHNLKAAQLKQMQQQEEQKWEKRRAKIMKEFQPVLVN